VARCAAGPVFGTVGAWAQWRRVGEVTYGLAVDPRRAVHTELTRNARGGLIPAQEHGAGTSGAKYKDDHVNDDTSRCGVRRTGPIKRRQVRTEMNNKTDGTGGRLARPRRATVPAALAAVLAGAVLLAACGSASPSSGSGPSTPQQKTAALTQCMRSHGQSTFDAAIEQVTTSSGKASELNFTGGKPGSAQYKSAMAACSHLFAGSPPPAATGQQIDSAVKSAQCMQAHGFPSYPEPDVKNGQILMVPLPSSIDTSSPQFQAAAKTCGEPYRHRGLDMSP
jgi:hypothetical protein